MEGIGTIIVDRSASGTARVDKLLEDYVGQKLSEEKGCTLDSLLQIREAIIGKDCADARAYKVFANCFMERRMWREALCDLHCSLYLIDKESDEYNDTMEVIANLQRKLLSELMPIPLLFKEKLFLRDLEENWSRWVSRMGYTKHLTNISNVDDAVTYNSNTLVTKVPLLPGSLLMRIRPFSTAPWSMDTVEVVSNDGSIYHGRSCFHCLSVISSPDDQYYEKTTLVSCPQKPYECSRVFCSEECFLNNGAVHAIECAHLLKLKSFAATHLNDALVLLVVRTLIRCGICRDKKNYSLVTESEDEQEARIRSEDVLQRILKVKVDYSILEVHHQGVLEDIKLFARFLVMELGVQFCLCLTPRELAHFIVVLWTKSLPLTPERYTGLEQHKLGGVAFNLNLFGLQQSTSPTLTVHFDTKGRLAIRSIYNMEPGTRLYINTVMDKYLPLYKQKQEFWSVSLLLSLAIGEVKPNIGAGRTICALRCNICIRSFCYAAGFEKGEQVTEDGAPNYVWVCEHCKLGNPEDLNLLQKKAESIVMRAHRLYDAGQHLVAKRMLKSFVSKWSGVLHWNHYLLYNAQVLLAGIQMNKAGSNIQLALKYLIAAILMAEEMLPKVCHEKAHLYSRLAELMGQMVMSARMSRKDDDQLKKMTMEAAYTSLWNWTVIAGSESREALLEMQKCRCLAFQMNTHAPSLSNNFVINIPGKYIEVYKLVTGACVIPSILKFSTVNLTDVSTDHVATIAFMAAQNGILTDSVLEVLMAVEACGIPHLGTGLTILGIAASNGNVELVKAITEAISTKTAKAFEFLGTQEDTTEVEKTIVNLLLSLVGGNELGITPLMAMASVPPGQDSTLLKSDVAIARVIIECAEKCDYVISKQKEDLLLKSPYLKWFASSSVTLKGLLLDARTHVFLRGQTVLHYAASKGKRNLVQYLARVIGNVNQMNLEGATPLHLAALGGHVSVCETLIGFGADQTVPLVTGELPIHLAIHSLHEPTVNLLLEHYMRRTAETDPSSSSAGIGKMKKRGPSIWHALVAGIYDQKTEENVSEDGNIALSTIVSRLTKAVQIAQIMTEQTGTQETYVWSDTTPSQILRRKWEEYMELNSHDFDPRENFEKLHLDNVNSVLRHKTQGRQGKHGNSIINDRTDAILAATRAVQFLSQLLQRAEETAMEAVRIKMAQPPAPTINDNKP